MPPINPHIAPRHKAARITKQINRRTAILFRPTQLAQHVLLRPLLAPLGVFLEQLFDHRGHDVAGGDGVDADAVRAPFGGEVARELDYAGFGGIVGRADQTL